MVEHTSRQSNYQGNAIIKFQQLELLHNMKKSVAVIIDWFGPYSLDSAKLAAKEDYAGGAYIAIGRKKYRKESKVQYFGISSTKLSTRLKKDHHKLVKIAPPFTIWLGEVSSTGISGPKNKKTDLQLDLAEWAYVRFLDMPLNDKKKVTLPDRGVTVINRWWKKDFETPLKRRPRSDWPILIDYPGDGFPHHIAWKWGK